MFVPVLQLRAQNTAWLLGMVNYSWSLHIVLESPVCQKQDSWKKANKQKPSLRRVGSDIKGSSSVLPESPTCIFTDNEKNITEVLRNSTDPNCSHSMPKFCLCCHGNVPPTRKVHNINCIIRFSISFEGNELSTCHFTSHKKSCPRTKTGVSTGNDYLIKNLISPHVRSPHAPEKSSQITHIDYHSHTLQLFLHTKGVDSYSWHFHT